MAATGIRQRHGRACDGQGRCQCPWQASVYSRRDGKKLRQQFPTRAAAVEWRDKSRVGVREGKVRAPTQVTVAQAVEAWLESAESGLICRRGGEPYKHSAIRAYEQAWRLRIEPRLGRYKLSAVTRRDVQDLVDELRAHIQDNGKPLNASTIGTTLNLLRNVYRRAVSREEISINPTTGLEMPAVRGGRDRIASPDEGARLLAALPPGDRAVWATAMYGGLRRGELMALRLEDLNLGAGKIHVRRGWDTVDAKEISTKNRKERRVPIAVALRDHLVEHVMSLEWSDGLVFGTSSTLPFSPTPLTNRAARAWRSAGLDRITLHECRHTFASLMIAAGVNAKALSEYMGHANISITLDRYGHLMPGNEEEAAALLDAYLERANTAARMAAVEAIS